MSSYLLSALLVIPLIGCIAILFLPDSGKHFYKYITLVSTALVLILSILIYLKTGNSENLTGVDNPNNLALVEQAAWFSLSFGDFGHVEIEYFLGVDGINAPMILLSGLILFFGAIASWNIQFRLKGYHTLYLILSTSIIGCFISLDLFLFFLFFEFMLLPMYFLIGIWGGKRREYAAIKFFIYTLLGSVFILIVMIVLYSSIIDPIKTGFEAGILSNKTFTEEGVRVVQTELSGGSIKPESYVRTFNMLYMADSANYLPSSLLSVNNTISLFGLPLRLYGFLLLFLGFAIKLPAVPLHTWLPDAHVEAPTPISVILAGLLLKVGAYGFIRICYPIFPEGALYFSTLIGILGMVAIIYGALNALAMKDLKKMIAYSSVSHMGYVLLGLASVTIEGIAGAIYQMFSHGLISSALFLIAGIIYDRTGDRQIENFRGLAAKMPFYTAITVIIFFAGLGLPGFSGFIGEVLVYFGAFKSAGTNGMLATWIPVIATFGLLLNAGYFLWTLQRMFFGPFWTKNPEYVLSDCDGREKFLFLSLVLLVVLFGLFPSLLLNISSKSVERLTHIILTEGFYNLKILGIN